MNREEVRARIEEIGIIPAIRVSSPDEARFAAAAVSSSGIPIVEIYYDRARSMRPDS